MNNILDYVKPLVDTIYKVVVVSASNLKKTFNSMNQLHFTTSRSPIATTLTTIAQTPFTD